MPFSRRFGTPGVARGTPIPAKKWIFGTASEQSPLFAFGEKWPITPAAVDIIRSPPKASVFPSLGEWPRLVDVLWERGSSR